MSMNDNISVCACGEPLVTDLSVRGCEWGCVICDRHYPLFGPTRVPATPELWARWNELREMKRARR
jgi:hypothetical protein